MSLHHSVDRSLADYRRALQLIPGATQLISRRASRFAYGVSPIYAARAKGSHVWDVDGNEFIDWMSSLNAIILGYADDVVDNAVKQQIDWGTIYTLNHECEIELAEELVDTIPSAEMVRYAKGGSEACAIAIRIARGATGQDRVLFSGYHGWHDWYLAANLSLHESQEDRLPLDEHLFPGIDPIGVPRSLAGTTLPFRYGDIAQLESLLYRHRGEVACIIMEPMRSQLPQPGYLETVRELATSYEVILIFDEVSLGPRPAIGGAQQYLGVTPDMTVLAKAMSNGYPMGAVVGKASVMEPAANMFISSTYWSDTIGITAALTTYRELKRRNAIEQIHQTGRLLKTKIHDAIDDVGVSVQCTGCDWHPVIRFDIDEPMLRKKVGLLYMQEMARRGIFAPLSFYVSAAHSEDDVLRTVVAAREAFTIIHDAVEHGEVDKFLIVPIMEDSFRRHE